jgi:hypothetical protein
MAYAGDASGRWLQMEGKRCGFINRCEKYAAFTIPKLLPHESYDQNHHELSHDFQAVGAQAVNHLANKIMLALFAPSRPFFRLDADAELEATLTALGVGKSEMVEMLAMGEKKAIAELDRMSIRPKLYEAVKHLIVTGNALLILEPEGARVVGLRNYCVRRSMSGAILEILQADKVMFDELDPEVQAVCSKWVGGVYKNNEDREVCLYRWIKRDANGDYRMTQWVDQHQLPAEFNGRWPEDQLPFRVLTWDLSDDADYGTGLVEDYQGDFAGLSMLSKAQVMGAILSSEFRWLVNPGGMTRPEDFRDSENGAAIPGQDGDVTIIQSNKSGDLQIVMSVGQEYITRIGRGFLLGSAVTRDAERVTAEEIRMQATELETSLGGAYSRLAVDFQIPMAYWLMDKVGFKLGESRVRPSIVTGLDALSRTGDLEDLKLWLADMAGLQSMPPELLGVLNLDAVAKAFAAARRINTGEFMKTPEQIEAERRAAIEQQTMALAQEQGVQIAGEVAKTQAQGVPA